MSVGDSSTQHGFQFPGTFEASVLGDVHAQLETLLPVALKASGVTVLPETTSKYSANSRFVSVRLTFHARDRDDYNRIYTLLRTHPGVQWVL